MAYFFNGATHNFERGDAIVQTWPITMVGRIRLITPGDGLDHNIMGLWEAGSNNGFRVQVEFAGGFSKARCGSKASGSASNATSSTSITDSNWHTVIGEITAANARQVWLDNGGNGSNATSLTPGTLTKTTAGAIDAGGTLSGNSGHELADVALFTGTLTADERAAYHAGFSPLLIRPDILAIYLPMVRGPLDLMGDNFTLTNAIVVDHPRVYMPIPSIVCSVPVTTAYSLACAAGSFSLSGQAAGLPAQRRLPSAAGSFVLSGQTAGLPAQRRLPSSVGAFTLSGQAAILAAARRLASSAGAFSLTGIAARLAALRNMPAGAGAFTLTGVAAGLRSARNLTSGTGAFVLSGQAASLTYQAGHTLAAAPGSFILTGIAARLAATRIIVAAKGAFTLSGQTAILSAQHRVSAAAGAFTLTGRAAVLSSQRRLVSAPGTYVVAGQAAILLHGARLPIWTGVFTLTGQEALLSGSSALIGGGSPARTFAATIRDATFKGDPRDSVFRRQG